MNPPLPDIRPGETIIINGERFVTWYREHRVGEYPLDRLDFV